MDVPFLLSEAQMRRIEPYFPCLMGLKRPGFSGGSFIWVMQPYRGSLGLHSSSLRPRRVGYAR
jgi:hypothetical protein